MLAPPVPIARDGSDSSTAPTAQKCEDFFFFNTLHLLDQALGTSSGTT